MFFTLKSSLSIVPYLAAITFSEMWKKIWRKEKRAAVVESSATAAGAQWVAAESSTAAAGWSAAAEAKCVAAGWSMAAESSMAAARRSVPDSFKKFEREREKNFYSHSYWVGQFRARHSLDTKVLNWALGVGKRGVRGRGLPHPSPQAKVLNC